MTEWSLSDVLSRLHDDVETNLANIRGGIGHPTAKGDASERVWNNLFKTYLPERYSADNAHVVDSDGNFSDQIDVVIYDRQYSPFIFHYAGTKVIPAESVYAVFETKQSANAGNVRYAQEKASSVRRLNRTTMPIVHAGSATPTKPKEPFDIIAGLLTIESDWSPEIGDPFLASLMKDQAAGKLSIGCVASHGFFRWQADTGDYDMRPHQKSSTAFLFALIGDLQKLGTVTQLDVAAYAKWLDM